MLHIKYQTNTAEYESCIHIKSKERYLGSQFPIQEMDNHVITLKVLTKGAYISNSKAVTCLDQKLQ